MPKNRLIYLGVLVVAASALLFLAFKFTQLVQPALPYSLGVGVLMIIGGIFWEAKKGSAAGLKPGDQSAENIKETKL
jgi:hypothetical protein